MQLSLGILGGGRAAWAYGSTWRRLGWPLSGVWLRNESRSRIADLLDVRRRSVEALASNSDVLLIAVSDSAIEEIAASVPQTEAIVFHASGARRSVRGGFSLHPLKVLPAVGEPSDLRDALLVFEGSHRDTASRIAAAAGARFAEVRPEQKALYHAGAVFGANYVAAMLEIGYRLVSRAGVSDSRQDLAALAVSAVENWRASEDSRRFTGPAARGDASVMAEHIAAISDDPQVIEIYKLLAAEIAGAILATPK